MGHGGHRERAAVLLPFTLQRWACVHGFAGQEACIHMRLCINELLWVLWDLAYTRGKKIGASALATFAADVKHRHA